MTQLTCELRFEGVDVSEAGIRAKILGDEIRYAGDVDSIEVKKDDPTAMDFGATLILVLGTPAVIALAKGIQAFLVRVGGTVTITSDGGIVTQGISGSDVAAIAAALSKKK
jgi:hypothetical protein